MICRCPNQGSSWTVHQASSVQVLSISLCKVNIREETFQLKNFVSTLTKISFSDKDGRAQFLVCCQLPHLIDNHYNQFLQQTLRFIATKNDNFCVEVSQSLDTCKYNDFQSHSHYSTLKVCDNANYPPSPPHTHRYTTLKSLQLRTLKSLQNQIGPQIGLHIPWISTPGDMPTKKNLRNRIGLGSHHGYLQYLVT